MPNTKVVGIIFPYILTPIPNLYDHSFPRYGQITFLTFRRPPTLTFVSHGVPIRNVHAKFHNDRLGYGWDITLWNFAKTRTNKHTHTQTNKHTHTHKQTNRHGHYNTSPSPYGGRGNYSFNQYIDAIYHKTIYIISIHINTSHMTLLF